MLVPSCSRQVEPGMVVHTRTERVDHARKMVLEFLGSSVDLSLHRHVDRVERRVRRRPDALRRRGRHRRPAGQGRQRPVRPRLREVHPLLQVRRRLRRAVAEHLRHRRRRPRVRRHGCRPSTTSPLPDSACVYCGNCIEVCPTGALMFTSEHDMRADGTWDESTARPSPTRSARTAGSAATSRLHVQDNTIVKVMSPERPARSPTATCASRAASASSTSRTVRADRRSGYEPQTYESQTVGVAVTVTGVSSCSTVRWQRSTWPVDSSPDLGLGDVAHALDHPVAAGVEHAPRRRVGRAGDLADSRMRGFSSPSTLGTADSSASVYGWFGPSKICRRWCRAP